MGWALTSRLSSLLRFGRGRRVVAGAGAPPGGAPLVLYEFEACPFCRKVREAMTELDLVYECRPTARGAARRAEAPTLPSGAASFPYLVDPNTGQAMHESEDILEYLHATYGAGPRTAARRALTPLVDVGAALASLLRPGGRFVRAGVPAEPRDLEPLVLYGTEGSPGTRRVRERLCELDLVSQVRPVGVGTRRAAALDQAWRALGPGEGSREAADIEAPGIPLLVDPNTAARRAGPEAILTYLEATYGPAREALPAQAKP